MTFSPYLERSLSACLRGGRKRRGVQYPTTFLFQQFGGPENCRVARCRLESTSSRKDKEIAVDIIPQFRSHVKKAKATLLVGSTQDTVVPVLVGEAKIARARITQAAISHKLPKLVECASVVEGRWCERIAETRVQRECVFGSVGGAALAFTRRAARPWVGGGTVVLPAVAEDALAICGLLLAVMTTSHHDAKIPLIS